jgi:hypothetical protein
VAKFDEKIHQYKVKTIKLKQAKRRLLNIMLGLELVTFVFFGWTLSLCLHGFGDAIGGKQEL